MICILNNEISGPFGSIHNPRTSVLKCVQVKNVSELDSLALKSNSKSKEFVPAFEY